MKRLSRVALFFLVVLSLGSGTQKVWAIAYGSGGELIYEYINDSTYRFYYKFYRSCSSDITENNEYSLCYRNTCSGIWYTEMLVKAPLTPYGTPNGQMVDEGCAGQPNTCTDPTSTLEMYREWWYTGVVVLPEPCDHWTFSVNVTERDRDYLTNLAIMPLMQHNLYVEATINTLSAPKQSSPYFTAPLPVYTCSGSPVNYNLGVVDPDGDSLVYKLIQPRAATTDIFVVCSGYPPFTLAFAGAQYNLNNNPLETGNTFNLNAATGDVSFTPGAAPQVAYLAYLVEKYRNGQLIGTVMRDARLEVKDCNAPPVQFTVNAAGVSGGTFVQDTLMVCGDTEVNLCFEATTTTPAAVLMVSDNSYITLKGAAVSYQNQASGSVTGCITWTPDAGDTGFRYFIVTVKDSTCGLSDYPVIQTFKIPVYVSPGTSIQAMDTLVCPGAVTTLKASGGGNFQWSVYPGDPEVLFSCTACDSTVITPSNTSRIIVTSNLANGCKSTDTVEIAVDHFNRVDISPDGPVVLCEGGAYVLLSARASGPKPLKTIACGPSSECSGIMDSVQIAEESHNSYSDNMMYNFAEYFGPFYQYNSTQKMQVVYRKEELKAVGMRSGTLNKIAINLAPFAGTNPTFTNVKISVRCTDKFQFTTRAHSEFETGLTQVFSASSLSLQPGWNEFEFTTPYDYDTSKNLVVQFCYSGVSPLADQMGGTGQLGVYYVTTTYNASISAGQRAPGDVCASNIGSIRTHNRRPDTRFVFCEAQETDFTYTWSPPAGMDDPGADSTGVFAHSSQWYTVRTAGRGGCIVEDSIFVYVADNNFKVDPDSSDVCLGDAIVLHAVDAHQSSWYDENFATPSGFSCTDCLEPVVSPPSLGWHGYQVVMADSFGCEDTLQAAIYVKPVPETNILNNDTVIAYGESLRLFAEGAFRYLWSPVSSLNDPWSASPIASPESTTLYIVTGYLEDGCYLKDSVLVEVDRRGSILIPSAFSPNGDGINDLFRIENLAFQKVNSFLVFNRYGQEVYNGAGDANNPGWDGTVAGKPADVGTYYYLIRLVYPGGEVKIHRGDVTLIR